jgi:hypothetical protein
MVFYVGGVGKAEARHETGYFGLRGRRRTYEIGYARQMSKILNSIQNEKS